jgi:hypothetical protein
MFLLILLVLSQLHGEIVNLVTHQAVTNIWFEVGFAKISNVDWVSISTFQTFSKPLIFISHPDLSSTSNFPTVPRLNNILQTGGGVVSFQTKLYLPNDSYCSKQWYIPQYIQPSKQVSWAVFESGAYNVSGRPLYLSEGPIYRLSSSGLPAFPILSCSLLFFFSPSLPPSLSPSFYLFHFSFSTRRCAQDPQALSRSISQPVVSPRLSLAPVQAQE